MNAQELVWNMFSSSQDNLTEAWEILQQSYLHCLPKHNQDSCDALFPSCIWVERENLCKASEPLSQTLTGMFTRLAEMFPDFSIPFIFIRYVILDIPYRTALELQLGKHTTVTLQELHHLLLPLWAIPFPSKGEHAIQRYVYTCLSCNKMQNAIYITSVIQHPVLIPMFFFLGLYFLIHVRDVGSGLRESFYHLCMNEQLRLHHKPRELLQTAFLPSTPSTEYVLVRGTLWITVVTQQFTLGKHLLYVSQLNDQENPEALVGLLPRHFHQRQDNVLLGLLCLQFVWYENAPAMIHTAFDSPLPDLDVRRLAHNVIVDQPYVFSNASIQPQTSLLTHRSIHQGTTFVTNDDQYVQHVRDCLKGIRLFHVFLWVNPTENFVWYHPIDSTDGSMKGPWIILHLRESDACENIQRLCGIARIYARCEEDGYRQLMKQKYDALWNDATFLRDVLTATTYPWFLTNFQELAVVSNKSYGITQTKYQR